MAPSAKGKEKVIDDKGSKAAGKRKRNTAGDNEKTGSKKRMNRGVLQFFEGAAYEVGKDEASDDDDSFFGDDFLGDEFGGDIKVPDEPSKVPRLPFVPKEEPMTEEELEKMLQERYKPGSSFVTYAEDNYESKGSIERNAYLSSSTDPVIWKVKCVVGRERHSAFCLMQKYVDLLYLGTKLQIISAFALDHVKGFIYIEAEKQRDINEACNGLCSIYSSRLAPVPTDEISHLFSVRGKRDGISEGMWARVKSGTYKGDLAQVAAVNDARKKVTVKLIPRIDLQALAEKFGSGITPDKPVTPTPRLISSSELEEFRPLIQYRRDRDTNKIFEILDGMMLKDGYLYKKVSIDSLNFGGVTPTEDELLKFEPSKNDEFHDVEWLSQLYGERKKKRPVISVKGCGKGEGSYTSSMENKFEVHDLVFFGKKEFGVIIGSEKDDSFKIIKEGSEGPLTVNIQLRELKNAAFDKKLFTTLDQNMKNISIGDTVKVLDGPLKDRQGMVKKIYRGIVFLYNETEEENNGYICIRAKMCEKVDPPGGACNEKGGDPVPASAFGEFCPSPKSPLSPSKSLEGRDGSFNFKRDDNSMFCIGQLLRIRVGPLKGYLCRVLAVRRSEVTVKLDSRHRILTVKCEDLSEVRGKSSGISPWGDADSAKPGDWTDGAATATEDGSWNAGGISAERSSWPAFPTSNISLQPDSISTTPKSMDEETNKGDSSWEAKGTQGQCSSWGTAAAAQGTAADTEASGWGSQVKAASATGFGNSASDSWGKAVESHQATGDGLKDDPWDDGTGNKSAWNSFGAAHEKQTGEWGNAGGSLNQSEDNTWNKATTANEVKTVSWGGVKKDGESTGGWEKKTSSLDQAAENQERGSSEENKKDPWGTPSEKSNMIDGYTGNKNGVGGSSASSDRQSGGWSKTVGVSHGGSSWNKQGGETSWSKQDGGETSWSKQDGKSSGSKSEGGTSSWSKPDGGPSSWSKQSGGSSWNKQGGETSWCKLDDGSSWSKPEGGTSSWSKQDEGPWKKREGGASWNKKAGGSSWSQQSNENAEAECRSAGQNDSWERTKDFGCDKGSGSWKAGFGNKGDTDQHESWGRPKEFDSGRGSGGRRGRGRGWGGRDQFGRGRSFGQGESSNWTKDGEDNNGSNDRVFRGKESSWNGSQGGGWGGKEDDTWNNANTSVKDSESKWNKGWGADKEMIRDGTKWCGTGWNGGQAKDLDVNDGNAGNESAGWQGKDNSNAGKQSDGTWSSGWNKGSVSNEQKIKSKDKDEAWNAGGTSTADESHGWTKGASGSEREQPSWHGKSSSWQNSRNPQDNLASDWNKSSTANKGGKSVDVGGGWQKRETPIEDSKSPAWKSSTSSLDKNQASAWGSKSGWDTPKASDGDWNNSSWDQKSACNLVDGEADNSGGWNNKKSSDGGSSSGWGQSKWIRKSITDGNPDSWGSKSNWNSVNLGGNEETDTFCDQGRGGWRGGGGGRWGSDRGRFGVRGGSDRDGFGGRGRSDRGDFGGWGGSDREDYGGSSGSDRGGYRGRGGFGGRVGSDRGDYGGSGGSDTGGYCGRGGFGGRGRGRRDDWKNINDSGEDKPYSWNNASTKDTSWSSDNAKGWTGNTSGGSWKGGGSDKNQWQGATSDWNKPKGEGKDNVQATGWNKGSSLSKDDGGSDAKSAGWTSQENSWKPSSSAVRPTSSAWNQPTASGGEGAATVDAWGKPAANSWSQPKDAKLAGSTSQENSWKPSSSSVGPTSSLWNQPTADSGEGAGTVDAWGQAAANSWSQPKDGGSKVKEGGDMSTQV